MSPFGVAEANNSFVYYLLDAVVADGPGSAHPSSRVTNIFVLQVKLSLYPVLFREIDDRLRKFFGGIE